MAEPKVRTHANRVHRVKSVHHPVYRATIKRLVSARKERGLTQVRVARVFGVHRQWVSKIENFELSLDVLSLLRLCRVYRIRPTVLVRWMEKELSASGDFFSLLQVAFRVGSGIWRIPRIPVVLALAFQSCSQLGLSDGGGRSANFLSDSADYRINIDSTAL